ncbi:MAG TPA: S8 family serine peptidase [Tepidisphaeraceae bacterium]|nr:S8 family serine peptidase [Tepidisphaeraceae bacterium]
MSHSLPKYFPVEALEPRRMFAFSQYAQLINQDLALENHAHITGKGQTVAVIDTGVNYNLPQLGGGFGTGFKVVAGYDFVNNDDDPLDTAGHGTSVAAAVAGNRWTLGSLDPIEFQGIAPEANIVALRASRGTFFTDEDLERSLRWIIDNHRTYNITVVNMSLGEGNYNEVTVDALSDEIKQIHDLGIFVVVSSGNANDGQEPPIHEDGIGSPAADPYTFAVGAVDADDVIADFAQRSSELDLLAPGVRIILPGLNGTLLPIDGTSFAAPMVAGVAALIKEIDPSARPEDIGSILMTSGIANFDGDKEVGGTSGLRFSRLNIDAALKLAKQRIGKYETIQTGARFDTALDSQHILHAAWYDAPNGRLLYSTRDATGLWSNAYIVDENGDVGLNLSIAVDALGQIGIGYFDATNTALKYATLSGDPETGWTTQTIESNKHVGLSPSLDYDIQGNAYLAYYRRSGGDLRLATLDRDTGVWTLDTIDGLDGADVGREISLDVGEAPFHVPDGFTIFNTTVAMAYADSTNGNLKYARLNLDDADETWFVSTVDDTQGVANINLSLHFGSPFTGLQAQIAYQDRITADVRFAYRNVDWFVETIASNGRLGDSVQMYFEKNTPLVTYYNHNQNGLFIAARTGANEWRSRRSVLSSGPQSIAFNERTHSVFYSWLEPDGDISALRIL